MAGTIIGICGGGGKGENGAVRRFLGGLARGNDVKSPHCRAKYCAAIDGDFVAFLWS
jgi:hypothetical protein